MVPDSDAHLSMLRITEVPVRMMPHIQTLRSAERRRGFTLVEILVVVAILGIMATIVGIHIGSRNDLKVNSAARVLVANLQYLQNRAIVGRKAQWVVVGAGGGSLEFSERVSTSWQILEHPIEHNDYVMVFGPGGRGGGQDVTLSTHDYDGRAVLGFDEYGAPILCDGDGTDITPADTETSFMLNAGDFNATVAIQPITGEISVR